MSALRLLIFGTRPAWGRLIGIVAGTAVGVVLALLLVAGANALETRDVRASWLHPSLSEIETTTASAAVAAPSDDVYAGARIARLDVAIPAESMVRLPGMAAPEPGTFVASPALMDLIDHASPEALRDRYGTPAGLIPDDLLASPDSLVVVVGGTPEEVSAMYSAGVVEGFTTGAYGGNENYQILAFVGALALLIPAFLLVAVSTTLGAAARAERWQTLLTIGASRRVVTRIAVVEAVGTGTVGVVLGVGGFFALRPLLAMIPVAGERLVSSDLVVPVSTVLVVVGAVVLGSVLAAARSARRLRGSPTSQVVFENRPRMWRLLPLAAGLGFFVLVNVFADAIPVPLAIPVVGCFALLAVGLLVAGPYFTWLAGVLFTRFARSGGTVIASRRIVRTPRAGFRSVAGLVAATFVITVFAFAASAHVSANAYTTRPLLPEGAIAAAVGPDARLSEDLVTQGAQRVPGVSGTYFTYTDGERVYVAGEDARTLTGESFPGAVGELIGGVYSLSPAGSPLAKTEVASLDGMRVSDVIIITDGSTASVEQARTLLLTQDGIDHAAGAWTREEYASDTDSDLATQFTQIGRLAILIVTALAAAVLTVSTIAALHERKRTFSLLQLIGMPRGTLRTVISWETLMPLLSILAPTVALGWFTAFMLITTLSPRTLSWPDPLLTISLGATAIMTIASIAVAARIGTTIARSAQNTREE